MSSLGFKQKKRLDTPTRKRPSFSSKRQSKGVPATKGAMQRKGELKFCDIQLQTTGINTTGSLQLMQAPVPGSLETNRIGRKIMMKSLHFTGRLVASGNANAALQDYLRIMIIYDRQPNGALPGIADVIQSVDNAGTTSTNSQDHFNISNAERFKILRDWRVPIAGSNGAMVLGLNSSQIAQFFPGATKDGFLGGVLEAYIPLKGLETHFNTGTAGTIADISSGSLIFVTFGAVAVATAPWSVLWTCRMRYWDH